MALSRREFLITVAGMPAGRAVLEFEPSNPSEDAPGELPKIRLATLPSKAERPDGGYTMVWVELTEDGPSTMMWQPETPQELADAQAFYDAALNYEGVAGVEQAPKTAAGKVAKWLRDLVEPDPRRRTKAEKELLRAIVANPDDDGPLLRYAAWLEKKGSPQGEFIRVDRELDSMTSDDPRRPPLDARWTELYTQHAENFVFPLQKVGLAPVAGGVICPALSLKRGVIGRVDVCRPGVVPEKIDDLFALAPLIDEMVLNFENIPLKEIVARKEMSQVRSLSISANQGGLEPDGIKALAKSPHIRGLTELDLSFTECGPDGAYWLSKAPFLAQLRRLGLHGAQIGREGLDHLLARDAFSSLRTLGLSANDLDGDALNSLAKCSSLGLLEHLTLEDNKNAWDGLPALAEATFAGTLLSLNISYTNPISQELAGFARGHYTRLAYLFASSIRLNAAGLSAFVDSDWIAGLSELDLGSNELTTDAGSLLATIPFRRLELLNLGSNRLGDKGLAALVCSPHLETLRNLDVMSASITADGVRALVNSPRLRQLECLRIDGNDIGYEGAVLLAKTQGLKLNDVWVDAKSVGAKGKTLLKKRFGDGMSFS